MKRENKNRLGIAALFVSLFIWSICPLGSNAPGTAIAAEVIQDLQLQPGWNAVFLEVEPQDNDPAVVFADLITAGSLISVWMWNPKTSTVEFIQDPAMPVPQGSTWLVYYPADEALTNLHAIHGNTAYLINMNAAASLTITGEPTIPHIDWKPNSFNFVGFHLASGQEPFFDDFFSSSLSHAGQDIYVLDNGTGNWVKNPAVPMKKGEAFWVYCHGYSEFIGPLSVQPEQFSGLHYGKGLQEQSLLLRNNSAAPKSVSLSLTGWSPSPGSDPLYYWVFDPGNGVAGWTEFPPGPLTVPAGDKQNLRLGVKRAGLIADTTYDANMTVTDNQGMEILLPVSVTGISYGGLWVGDATITEVSQPANISDAGTPVKTGSEFSFRLIVHAEEAGPVRLLSQVIQMWQEGTWKPDPNDLGKQIVDEPGSFVLLADDSFIPDYSGAAMRDGQLVGRRISAPAFPALTADQRIMTGSMDPPAGALTVTITLAPDDPTNPFMHRYNPDHRVRDIDGQIIDEQAYEVTRMITMTFSDVDQEGRPITGVPALGWGSSEIGGIYTETITGLHRDPLNIKGTFLLRKVSDIGTLEVAP